MLNYVKTAFWGIFGYFGGKLGYKVTPYNYVYYVLFLVLNCVDQWNSGVCLFFYISLVVWEIKCLVYSHCQPIPKTFPGTLVLLDLIVN